MTDIVPFSRVSFRDPDGVLDVHEGRVLRLLRPEAATRFAQVLAHPTVARLIDRGDVVGTRQAANDSAPASWQKYPGTIYEHERIPFVSHPSEWSPIMLARAAEHTLEVALQLLRDGFILKDATPKNVLFRGPRPVLVDVPSIVQRPPGSFLWLARQQFEACFLLPLIANVEAGLPIAWSMQDSVRGISHELVARMVGSRRWIKPSLLTSVALPAALTGHSVTAGHGAREPRMSNDEQARFVLERNLTGLLRSVRTLKRRVTRSQSGWSAYLQTRGHYQTADLDQKRAFVETSLERINARWVLDIGANTGEFSAIAARRSSVVAIDVDEAAAGRMYERASADDLDVLPLVVDFSRPTPASGWRNDESLSFLQRAQSRFDCVLMLAVIHHLRVTAGIPLAAVLDTVAQLTTQWLVIEFVPPTDPMFAQIARGRESLYDDYTSEGFEVALRRNFTIETQTPLANGRVMYLARKG